MTEDVSMSPEVIPEKINRPWVIYLVAIWAFVGISGFLSTIVHVLGQENKAILQFGGIAVLLFSMFFIINILHMKRIYLIVFGVLSIALALWQSFNIVGVLLSENSDNPVIYFLLFYTVPSFILAIVVLRPGFLELADKSRAFKHYELMQKASKKV